MKVRCSPTLAKMAVNFIAFALLLSRLSWATEASCGTTMALSNIGTGTGNGCYTVDQTFSNLVVANNGSSGAPVQSTSTVAIAGSSTWVSDAAPWINTTTFSGNTGANSDTAAPWTFTGSGVGTYLYGAIAVLTDSAESYFSPPGYPTPPSGASLLIANLSLSAIASTGLDSSDAIIVGLDFCIGAAACTLTGPTANGISLQELFQGSNLTTPSSYRCGYYSTSANAGATCSTVGSSVNPITVSLNNPAPTLSAVEYYYLVTAGASATTDSLTSFSINYGNEEVTPEPSSFPLLGAALVVLSMLKRTKRKRECREGNEGHP